MQQKTCYYEVSISVQMGKLQKFHDTSIQEVRKSQIFIQFFFFFFWKGGGSNIKDYDEHT